jgi:hypothetical protein
MTQNIPTLVSDAELVETKNVLRKAAAAHKALAELKGSITSIPNENIIAGYVNLTGSKRKLCYRNIVSTFAEIYQKQPVSAAVRFSRSKRSASICGGLKERLCSG